METSYKGFEITQSSADKRFRVYDNPEAFVPVFNKDGYATLNAAKCAITKAIKASPYYGNEGEQEPSAAVISRSKATTSDDAARATYKLSNPTDNEVRISRWKVRQMFGKDTEKGSRRQREGRYAGKVNGKPARWYAHIDNKHCESFVDGYYMPTRKARKHAKMEVVNSTRQGAFGGHIKDFDPSLDHLQEVPDNGY